MILFWGWLESESLDLLRGTKTFVYCRRHANHTYLELQKQLQRMSRFLDVTGSSRNAILEQARSRVRIQWAVVQEPAWRPYQVWQGGKDAWAIVIDGDEQPALV